MRKHISLTHVEYDTELDGPWLGKFLALSSLVPVMLVCAVAAQLYVHRRAPTAYLLAGLGAGECKSMICHRG